MKTYYTKVSKGKVFIIVLTLLVLTYFGPEDWRYYAGMGVILAITLVGMFTTRYTIDGTTLKIHKLLIPYTYDLTKLVTIKKGFSLWSDLASATDCLYLEFSDDKVVDLSPRQEEEFVEELRRDNPRVRVDRRKG